MSDDGGPGCAADTHDRERTEAEDHDRVQNDVGDGSAEHADHGHRHFAFRLKDFFKGDRRRDNGGEGKDDIGIVQTILQNVLILGKKTQEHRRAEDADRGQQDAMNQAVGHARGSRVVGFLTVLCAEKIGGDRVDADAEAYAYSRDQELQGIDQRDSGHGIFADPCHKVAVDNIVQRVGQHGQNHRQRHG